MRPTDLLQLGVMLLIRPLCLQFCGTTGDCILICRDRSIIALPLYAAMLNQAGYIVLNTFGYPFKQTLVVGVASA
jgi:hypothetical protein